MIDKDGDENYQPMVIPLDGGIPEPLFPQFAGHAADHRARGWRAQSARVSAWITAKEPVVDTYRVDLATKELTLLGTSPYGYTWPAQTTT